MNRTTGAALSGEEHLRQSIRDILTTPLGSLVMLREYGSRVPELLAKPLDQSFTLELAVATSEALSRWEPRIAVKRVAWTPVEFGSGRINVAITYSVLATGATITYGVRL